MIVMGIAENEFANNLIWISKLNIRILANYYIIISLKNILAVFGRELSMKKTTL